MISPTPPIPTHYPRGVRLHNPGNIRRNNTVWVGQASVQPDPAFVAFDQPVYGLRAVMKILQSYTHRGLDTPREIISTWAPPNENDTNAYIASVAGALGVTADTALDLHERAALVALVQAIVHQEQGAPPAGDPPHWYPATVYGAAADLVLA